MSVKSTKIFGLLFLGLFCHQAARAASLDLPLKAMERRIKALETRSAFSSPSKPHSKTHLCQAACGPHKKVAVIAEGRAAAFHYLTKICRDYGYSPKGTAQTCCQS